MKVFTVKNARFSVVTDRIIRMEYSPSAIFEDAASLTFTERENGIVKKATCKKCGDGIVISTKYLTLKYLGGEFTKDSLIIEHHMGIWIWHFGDEDKGNLLGTRRTLDGVRGWESGKAKMEKGILSRDGWAVVDDSQNFLFEKTKSEFDNWVKERRKEDGYLDLYFFGFGHDYKAALQDYTAIAGRIPLPPKWSFGYWWSRYWQYSAAEIRDLVQTMRSLSIPIDVMIIDMEWHDTWGLAAGASKDEFSESIGWTGYTWKKELFPSPKQLLSWCEEENLKTALNLHPASGIQPYESCYKAFAKAYKWKDAPAPIPFRICEEKWAKAWFDAVLSPMEKDGVSFWWLDWQQWMTSKYTPGLSNTYWLNYTMWKHMEKANEARPMIYHRWGGLGSHRYQTGFSGDTIANWEVLAFECWFTATSGNVCYGYWGHDLGGHGSDGKPTDGELYTRWLQYGVFSPTFKTHCAKELENERRIWMHSNYFLPMREAFKLRYRLAPYIYKEARRAYDTGISLCRPLYWEWPEAESSYAEKQILFQFGEDLLASAVTKPADPLTGLATMHYTLPEGRWYDVTKGAFVDGGKETAFTYTIDEQPIFARPGAIIPENVDGILNLQTPNSDLVLFFVPGEHGETEVYEDDGESKNYATEFATTRIVRDGDNVTIYPRKGDFAGSFSERAWTLRFPCRLPPKCVKANGKIASWRYDGIREEVVVTLPLLPVSKKIIITLEGSQERVKGDIGAFRRFSRLDEEYKYSFGEMVHPWAMLPDEYLTVSETAHFLQAEPKNAKKILASFDSKLKTFMAELIGKRKLSGDFATRLASQLNLPTPEPLPKFNYQRSLKVKDYGPWVARTNSKTAKFKVKEIDTEHFEIICSEKASADIELVIFSGFVRCQPINEDGSISQNIVLTRGIGMEKTLIFLSPYYNSLKFLVTINR